MSQRDQASERRRRRAVQQLCDRLGLSPEAPHLEQALTHPSFANEQPGADFVDNQRLEFLGDAVLGLCVSELLMQRFAGIDEGELTVMRAALVNAAALAGSARRVELAAALRLGRGADAAGERERTNVLADALEAVVGAAYVDHGLDKAREVCAAVITDQLDALAARGGIERDAKSRLQEQLQARGLAAPRYRVAAVGGPAHARSFSVEVETEHERGEWVVVGRGRGRSKKLAEQAAARAALEFLAQEDGTPAEPA